MPSMPSVPLMRARPSFSPRRTGVMPAAARALAASVSSPSADAHLALAHGDQGAVRERGEVARAAERSVLAHDRRDAGVEDRGVGLGGLAAHAGASGHERREAQQHEGAHDLALDLGARSRGVRAHEARLQLRAAVVGDEGGREGAEAGRDAVVRLGVGGEPLDDRAARGDLVEGGRVELDGCPVPGHGDDLVDGQRSDADGDGCRDGRGLGGRDGAHASDSTPASRARECRSRGIRPGSRTPRVGWRRDRAIEGARGRPDARDPGAPRRAARSGAGGDDRAGARAAPLHGVPPARRDAGARLRRAPARGAPLRPRHRRVRAVERVQPAAAPRAPRSPARGGARRPARRVGAPRGAARTRRALPRRGARAPPSLARDRRRRAPAGAPHRDRSRDARRAAAAAAPCAVSRSGGVRVAASAGRDERDGCRGLDATAA